MDFVKYIHTENLSRQSASWKCSMCSCQVVVYSGKRKLADLMKFLDKEMEKAKKDRILVSHFLCAAKRQCCSLYVSESCFSPQLKINIFCVSRRTKTGESTLRPWKQKRQKKPTKLKTSFNPKERSTVRVCACARVCVRVCEYLSQYSLNTDMVLSSPSSCDGLSVQSNLIKSPPELLKKKTNKQTF